MSNNFDDLSSSFSKHELPGILYDANIENLIVDVQQKTYASYEISTIRKFRNMP